MGAVQGGLPDLVVLGRAQVHGGVAQDAPAASGPRLYFKLVGHGSSEADYRM